MYDLSLQYSLHVFDQLMSAGRSYGMKLAGAYAVDTLRLEKGFRHWGHELDTETTPWEAGLGFAVDMNKVIEIDITDSQSGRNSLRNKFIPIIFFLNYYCMSDFLPVNNSARNSDLT